MWYHIGMKIQLPKYLYNSAESAKNTLLEHRMDDEQTSSRTTLEMEFDEGIWKDQLSKQYSFEENTFGEDIVKHRVGQILAQETVRKGEALPHPIPQEYEGVDLTSRTSPFSGIISRWSCASSRKSRNLSWENSLIERFYGRCLREFLAHFSQYPI
jgi:hypothetical protein